MASHLRVNLNRQAILVLYHLICPEETRLAKSTMRHSIYRTLEIASEFVRNHAGEIGLIKEEEAVPQKDMMRANQPQIVTIIKRN
jgi:hypothetical protein